MSERKLVAGASGLPLPTETTTLLRTFLEKSREFERKIEELTAVNPTDRLVMEHLIQGGPQTPSELAAAVGVTPAAMTTSVDRLEELGHAHRTPHESDRRKLVVTATERSVGVIMTELMSMVNDMDSLAEEFTETEMSAVSRYLKRVNAIYDDHLS
jgi:DNA-binding MarR family transcriptional regulator